MDRISFRTHLPKKSFHASFLLLCSLFFFAFFPGNPLLALDPTKATNQYIHEVWRYEEGLPQNSVQSILQTQDGYLWIGTHEGVIQFDGIQFTVFDRRNTPGIRNNSITSLAQTSDGRLWVGTEDGLSCLLHGKWSVLTKEQGLTDTYITDLFLDSRGILWIGTQTGGLNFLKDGKISHYTTTDGLPINYITSVREGLDGTILIGTMSGLTELKNGVFRTWKKTDGLVNNMVRTVFQDTDKTIWIGTNAGLSKFKNGRWTTITTKNGLAHDWVRKIYKDRDGNIWIGTSAGLNRMTNGVMSKYTSADGLSGEFLDAFCEDREGNLWMGSLSGGLDRFSSKKFTIYDQTNGLPNNEVRPIYQTRDGAIWIGTNGGGVTRVKNGVWKTYSRKDGLPFNGIRGICEDSDGSMWIATSGGGICRMQKNKVTVWNTGNGLANDYIYGFLRARDGTLWVGTRNGGINTLKDGVLKTITTKDGLGSNTIRVFLERRDGTILAGTDSGLTKFQNGKLTNYTKKDGLSYNVIYSLYEDDERTLWIGTYSGGLNRYKDGHFTAYTTKEGLFDDGVFQIIEDGRHYLWMTCNRGIYRVSKNELNDFADGKIRTIHSTMFGVADGMKTAKCDGSCQPAGIRTRDGHIWIPTLNGAVVINPETIEQNLIPPSVILEGTFFDGNQLTPDTILTAGPGDGNIEFQYTALNFTSPKTITFKYILEGFDKDWINAQTRRAAFYTNVPPGTYRFRVTACNNEGIWNPTGTSVVIIIAPHYYQTYWFYSLLGIAGIFLIALFLRIRTKALVNREQLLIRTVEERTKNLQQEINERKHAEEALRKSEELYRLISENSADVIWLLNPQTFRFTYVSPSVKYLLGYSEEEILNLKMEEILIPESLKLSKEMLRNNTKKILTGDLSYRINVVELDQPAKGGGIVHTEAVVTFLTDNLGKITSILGVSRDITERKLAEERLHESEERYHRLVDNAPFAISVHVDGKIVFVNPASVQLLGAEKESQIIGEQASRFINPDFREKLDSSGQDASKNPRAIFPREEQYMRFDGTNVNVETTGIPITFQERTATLVVARDITEQKRLQDQVVQAQKNQGIGTLASGIAHDFNNILGIILGYTSLIEHHKTNVERISEATAAIMQATNRGAALVRQILTFARKAEVVFEYLDVPGLIGELLQMMKQTFPKTVTFSENYAPDLPGIYADHSQIHQAILNLCINARDAMPKGGMITFNVSQCGGNQVREHFSSANADSYLCIAVSDTGTGIKESMRSRIFDPFFTTKEKGKGTGLGLSVVYGIMQSHQGFIDVDSTLGAGTTFSLYLPVPAPEKPEEDALSAATETPNGTETILAVEDEPTLLNILRLTMESKGYTVLTAVNGLEAVDVYRQHKDKIDLVVSDIGLPLMDGIHEFEKLKEINPDVAIILASGFLQPSERLDLQKSGVKSVLQKPYLPDELLVTIRKVLDRK